MRRSKASGELRTIVGVLVVAGGCAAGSAAAIQGCTLNNCSGTTVYMSADAGTVVDPTTWESSPWDGPWVSFPQEQTIFFDYSALAAVNGVQLVQPITIIPYLSADPSPNYPGSNMTIGSGNIAEIEQVGGNFTLKDGGLLPDGGFIQTDQVAIHNDSCQPWYLRVVVQIAPVDGGPVDGGGAPLAPTDASSDASEAGSSSRDASADATSS